MRAAVALISCILACITLHASHTEVPVIRNIYVDVRDVFDSTHNDWFFAGNLANALHGTTQSYIIEDELLFEEGDELDTIALLETERVLRRAGVFSYVKVSYDSVSPSEVDVTILTRDRWSLRPAVLVGTGGGISNYGAKIDELNLAGTATYVVGQALYRTENDIGWEGLATVSQRRLFRSEVSAIVSLQANSARTDQYVNLTKAYRTMSTPWAFGITASNSFGKDFAYMNGTTMALPFHERVYGGWISQASGVRDRLFVSASLRYDDVSRTIPSSRQAFDNTVQALVAFSSIKQKFKRSQFLNGYEIEDVQTGAWGSAILGRIVATDTVGTSMWYVGGQAEQSAFVWENTYALGRISAATGIAGGRAANTYLEVSGVAHQRVSDNFVLTSRAVSQTSWNWSSFRQLVLDFESGLRGYNANRFSGDNRFVVNTELRWFPRWQVWIAGVSAVAFYDMGTVWNQGTSLGAIRFHHAIGAGIRIHNLKASGDDAIFRFDVAYNVDDNRLSGLIFTTQQYFSAFGSHAYKVPDVLGRGLDLR